MGRSFLFGGGSSLIIFALSTASRGHHTLGLAEQIAVVVAAILATAGAFITARRLKWSPSIWVQVLGWLLGFFATPATIGLIYLTVRRLFV